MSSAMLFKRTSETLFHETQYEMKFQYAKLVCNDVPVDVLAITWHGRTDMSCGFTLMFVAPKSHIMHIGMDVLHNARLYGVPFN